MILGGHTLGEILNRIDTANRVSTVDAQVATQVQRFQVSVLRARTRAAAERIQVQRLVAERAAQQHAIEVRLGERRSLLGSLNGEVARLIAAQQAAQLRAARAAQVRVADVQTQATQVYADTAVGATAATPEGATVVPPSQYSGRRRRGDVRDRHAVPVGGLLARRVRLLRPRDVRLLADGRLAPALLLRDVERRCLGAERTSSSPATSSSSTASGTSGIYIGGGEFVHAPHTGTVVQVSSLDSGSYASGYVGARRVN